MICPHTLLFGLLFHAKAFRNNLTSKAQLRKLFVSKGCQQLLVPLDPEKADWYVFCKTELVKGVPTIQRTQPLSKSSMSSLLVTFGEIRGWPGAFHAHQFRYGSGKVINESGEQLFPIRHFLGSFQLLTFNFRMGQQGATYVDHEAR